MDGYGLHGGMTFVWVLPLLIVLAYVFYFNNQKQNRSARDILDERYAKGEIGTQEYEECLKKIDS